MATCPNKSVPEWKNMINHVGEFEAYRAYIAHGETIPNAVGMNQLKRTIGLSGGRYTLEKQKSIEAKVVKWNEENGTSHRVVLTQQGEDQTAFGTLEFNYLPMSIKAMQDRNKRSRGKQYHGMIDGESFQHVTNPELNKQFDQAHEIESQFAANTQFRMGPKYQVFAEVKQAELTGYYAERGKLTNERKNLRKGLDKNGEPLSAEKLEIRKRQVARLRAQVQEKIDQLEIDVVELLNLDRLDQITIYAEDDMNTLATIFAKAQPSGHELDIARRLIKFWRQAGDFSGEVPHPFFSPEELAKEDLPEKKDFEAWRSKAEGHQATLIQYEEDYVKREVRETTGYGGITEDDMDFTKPLPDISFLVKNLLDISEVDHVLFQAIARWVKDANNAARLEQEERFEELDRLIKATGLKDFEMFRQTFGNDSNQYTGEMVHVFTQDYFNWMADAKIEKNRQHNQASKKPSAVEGARIRRNANESFIKEMRKKTIVFDPRILFYNKNIPTADTSNPPSQTEIDAHIKELKDLLGEHMFNAYYEYAENKIDMYLEDHQNEQDRINNEDITDERKRQAMTVWITKYSPFLYAETIEKGYGRQSDPIPWNGETRYTHSIPREKDRESGESTGYYDDKFKRISGKDEYMELYVHMTSLMEEMKMYLPHEQVKFMQMNSVPFLKQKMVEEMSTGGVKDAFTTTGERLLEAVRSEDLSIEGVADEEDRLQISMVQNNKKRIREFIKLRDTEWRAKPKNEGEEPGAELTEKWKREIMDTIAKEKSFDLGRVMKGFTAMALTYHHKAAVQDQMKMASDIINRSVERQMNVIGEGKIDREGNELSEKGLVRLKSMIESFMNTAYWGYPSNKPEMAGKKKVLTKTEKELKVLLEQNLKDLEKIKPTGEEGEKGKLTHAEYVGRREVIEDQLAVLGGVKVASKYGDILLKYIQLKGMGWNVYAAFANMGFGFISNVIEASDGRNYSMANFRRAQLMVFHSVLKNYTFNKVETAQAKKIRTLMNDLDVLKLSRNELYKSSGEKLFKKVGDRLEWLDPYNPQARSEYFNQAPVMIAMMMSIKVKTDAGEEISLWDAYDTDGNIKEGINLGETRKDRVEFLSMIKGEIDQVVKMNHGNYDPDKPLAGKEKFIGRAATQFRTWALQGFAERFGHKDGFKDNNLTNRITGEEYIIRKGRYWSYGSYFNQDTENSKFNLPFKLMYELVGKLVGRKTKFDDIVSASETFTEVDAANMRKNLTEIIVLLSLVAMGLALKGAVDDDDSPEAKRRRMAYNLYINLIARLTTDMAFYVSPVEFERLSRNALPIFSLVVDGQKLLKSSTILLTQGSEEDILQSGPDKDKSRTWRDLMRMIPGPVQYKKIQSASSQVFKKN